METNGEQDGLWVVIVVRRIGSGSCPVAVFDFSSVRISGKGKVHPCIGTEALYRPYGP